MELSFLCADEHIARVGCFNTWYICISHVPGHAVLKCGDRGRGAHLRSLFFQYLGSFEIYI